MENVDVTFNEKKKGLFRTILDDHRDVEIYRHALTAIVFRLRGKMSGKTPVYKDDSGVIRLIFRLIEKQEDRIRELECELGALKRKDS